MVNLPTLLTLLALSLALLGCDLREGTIVYDVDFPRADANYGGGGSSSDGAGNTTATNDFRAGYRVSESGGSSSVTESGAGDTLTIRLVLEPLANVTLALVSVDTGEVTLSTNTLTFTPDNWDVDQTVNLSAVEDGIADGDQTTTVTVLVTGSGDKRYASDVPSTDLSVTTIDSGTIISPLPPATGPGITITQSGGSTTVTESGASDTITVVLNEAPTDNVTVAINKSNNGEISASPATVTFTTSNWNVAQTVTVRAVEDTNVDGDKDTTFTVGVSASNDSNYNAVADASVPVSVIDSGRVPGIVITSTGSTNQVSENGTTTDTITLVLNTPPSDNVTVTITDNDSSELTYLPDNLTFTPSDWNVAQTVTLTAIEDYVQDNHQTTLLTMTSSSGDATNHNLSSTTEVTTVDSQTAGGITISQSSLTLSESGATDTLTFKLNTPPLGNVTISLIDNDTDDSEISYSPDNLTFDNSTWNVAQTVTFSPLEDSIVDGDQTINLDVLVSSVGDPTYGSAMNTNRTVTVNDSGMLKPVLDNITVGEKQLTIYWQAQSVPDTYTLYWVDSASPPNSGNFTISNSPTSTSYVHGGLNSSLTYTYYLVANIGSSSSDNSTSLNNSPASLSCSPSYTTDTDSDLLVHYAFEDNLNDIASSGTTGSPYDLSNPGGTIKYAQSCAYGQAAYFDSTTGYLENNNFNKDNITSLDSGNFTIALWVNRDADMIEYASAISSNDQSNNSNLFGTWGDAIQIDVDEIGGNNYIRWNNAPGSQPDLQTALANQAFITDGTALTDWSYITAVHYDNNTAQFYRNGVLVGTHTTFPARWYKMKVGINRGGYVGNQNGLGLVWKGYIDEVKVFGRAFDENEVVNKCLAYSECSNLAPAIPDNLTAVVGIAADQVNLSWNPTNGTDNYTVYWTDNIPDNVTIDPDNASTYDNYTVVDNGTTLIVAGLITNQPYDFTVIATNTVGSSAPAEEVTATPVSNFTLGSSNLTVLERNDNSTTFALQQQPNGNVTVTLSSADNSQATISPTTLTFSSGNYSVGQTITLTGVEDFTVDNTATVTINVSYDSTDNSDLVEGLSSSFTIDVLDSGTVPPVIDNATPSEQQLKVYWQSYSGAENFTLYWTDDDNPQNSGNFTVSSGSTSYVHGGLDSSRTYTYQLSANIGAFSGLSNQVSNSPSAFASCSTSGTLTDTDPDLLVHYDFNNNLNDVHNKDGDGRYNLQNTGGTIKFAQGCGHGNSAYFDPSTGYAYNDNFTDDNETSLTGNFTITMWINGDDDNNKFSAPYSSGRKNVNSNHQIDVDSDDKLRILSNNNGNATTFIDSNPIVNGQWYHVAAVHDDQDNWTLYKNGVSVATGVAGATFEDLRIGINRRKTVPWKGYIDEVKVFGRAFDVDDVKDACLLYDQCDNLTAPATPDNLTATNVGDGTSVNVSWNAVNGVDNYTVYWTSTPGVEIDPNNASTYDNFTTVTAPTTSATATGLTPGGNYDFTVIATNSSSTGSSSPATEVNLLTNPSVPTGLTATSPSNSQINLTWNASTSASSYTVYWTANTGTPINPNDNTTYSGSTTISAPATSTSLTGLSAGSSYDFVVVATNAGGDSNATAEVNGETSPPTPDNLTITDDQHGTSVTASWNSSTAADNYTVYWTSNTGTTIDPSDPTTYDNSTTVNAPTTTVSASPLSNGVNYDFTVIATNTAGNSSPAAEVNATPILVPPAAVDNATAYHGFYSYYGTVYGSTYNFNPSYYITWNHHPDKASGDRYYIYISDNASVPIDPNDNTTYIATRQQSYNSNNTQILTAFSVYPENDPNFLVGIPPRFGVVFYDASKGVYSPISNQVTPPLASEALREIGDLRINSGYFSADNSTLSSFSIGTAIKIVQKDMINVGERFIIDGAFLSSDVIPQLGGSPSYDYLRLTFFNPAQTSNNGRVDDLGGYFEYKRQTPYLQTNTIRSNSPSVCGTNSAADCDFGMEIQGEDSVGMIIHNGTLNGATDYAADESRAPAYGNGEKQVGSVNVDNSSYAGLHVYTNNDVRVDINLTNADASMSKVAIPTPPPPGITITHTNGDTRVNEAGYSRDVYDWSELSVENSENIAVTVDPAGNAYVAGYSRISTQSSNDAKASVTKYNSAGSLQWTTRMDSSDSNWVEDIVVDSSGNSYLIGDGTGSYDGQSPPNGSSDIHITKINSSGTKQWTKFYGTSADDLVRSAEISNDVIYINAITSGTWATQSKSGTFDSLILTLDTDGNQTSVSQTGGADLLLYPTSLAVDSSGNYYQAGTIRRNYADPVLDGQTCIDNSDPNTTECVFIRKFNSSHSHQWTKLFDNSEYDTDVGKWNETAGGSIKLNNAEDRLYWATHSSSEKAINSQVNPLVNPANCTATSFFCDYGQTLHVSSLLTTNGDFDWSKWLPYFTSLSSQSSQVTGLAGRYGESGLAVDGSDNLYLLSFSPDLAGLSTYLSYSTPPFPANYGGLGSIQITKLNSSGVEQWSRITGGQNTRGRFEEISYDIHSSSGGQLHIVGQASSVTYKNGVGWLQKFHGDNLNKWYDGFLFKVDGTNNFIGQDSFTITLTGTQPTSDVKLTMSSSNTNEMIPQLNVRQSNSCPSGTCETITASDWDTPLMLYVAAVQDNTADPDTTPNLVITTSSSDAAWNNLTFNVPVTVVNQTQPGPYVSLGFDIGTIIEGDAGSQTRTLTAALDRVATSTVTVNLAAGSGEVCTADNSTDFSYPNSSVTIPAGQSEATQNVTIFGDTTAEDNETACIDISSVTNATEDGTQQARLNILMDPPNGTASINTGTTKTTSNKPEIDVRWNISGVSEQQSFKLYYRKSNTVDSGYQIDVNDNTTYHDIIDVNYPKRTKYYHGGLDVGKYYYYLLTANNDAGFTTDNVTVLVGPVEDFIKSTVNPDNDTALLVYYDFDNTTSSGLTNLSTITSNPSDYDLISGGGAAIEFGESKFQNADSSTNEAAYLNSTGGYVYNDNFNSDNESLDNFTISMWLYPDQDMPTFASAFATGDDTTNNKFQISDNGSSGIIAITENKSQWLEAGTIAQDNWTHVTAVKYADNNTLVLYLNGVVGINNMLSCPDNTKDSCADNNSLTTFNTNWEKLKIGVNRVSQSPWKGYIDEVKVYNRPLDSTEVNNLFRCDNPGGYGTCR